MSKVKGPKSLFGNWEWGADPTPPQNITRKREKNAIKKYPSLFFVFFVVNRQEVIIFRVLRVKKGTRGGQLPAPERAVDNNK